MKQLPLSRGLFALVDDEDYKKLSKFKWTILDSPKRNSTLYAYRTETIGYVEGKRKRKTILLHRELLRPEKGYVVDHINGDGLDNRRENLRICTYSQNAFNSRARSTNGFKGVTYDGVQDRWRALIKVNGKVRVIGQYQNAIDAARAYDNEARCAYGEFAWLNFAE